MNTTTENNVVEVISKATRAQAIYGEEAAKGEDKLRARVIARFKSELEMSANGSSTYFQNCKKRAAGEKVKHYYKPKGEAKSVVKTDEVEVEPVFVILQNGERQLMKSQQEAELFIKTYGGTIDLGEDQQEQEAAA